VSRLTKKGFQFDSSYVASHLQSWSIAECMKKLQAYEDSGLEPEEVVQLVGEMRTAYDENQQAYAVDATGYEAKHIADLLRAEANGCLLVTPCKPGDDVWFLFPDAVVPGGYYVTNPHRVIEVGTRGFWVSGYAGRDKNDIDDMAHFSPWSDIGNEAFFSEHEAREKLAAIVEGRQARGSEQC